MFGLGKKKENILAVSDGILVPIEQVPDEVFSQKMMGDGYAIKPSGNEIYAPVGGIISTVFPTGHAIGITTENGLELLIHMGLDTVDLKGKPFSNKVRQGQHIHNGELVSTMDLNAVEKSDRNPIIVVVYTNMGLFSEIPKIATKQIQHGDEIGFIKYK